MKKLVFVLAFVCLGQRSYAGNTACTSLFNVDENQTEYTPIDLMKVDEFMHIEEIEVSSAGSTRRDSQISVTELNGLRRRQEAVIAAPPREVRFGNKVAHAGEQKVVIEALIAGNKKVYEREIDLLNTNGSFDETGAYWIMPHNKGKIALWNFTKNRFLEIPLPENSELTNVTFDLSSNIYEPKVVVTYRELFPRTGLAEFGEIEVNLLNGQRL